MNEKTYTIRRMATLKKQTLTLNEFTHPPEMTAGLALSLACPELDQSDWSHQFFDANTKQTDQLAMRVFPTVKERHKQPQDLSTQHCHLDGWVRHRVGT